MVSERLDYANLIGAAWPIRYINISLLLDALIELIMTLFKILSLSFILFLIQTLLHAAVHVIEQHQARNFSETICAPDLVPERCVCGALYVRHENNNEMRGVDQGRRKF